MIRLDQVNAPSDRLEVIFHALVRPSASEKTLMPFA